MKISIITVCLNSESMIGFAIKSVSSQNYPSLEHIIIDGGSKDNTIKTILENNNRNLLLYSENDKGIYDAMNKGFKLASGEIIGFLNSDDFYADNTVLDLVAECFLDSTVDVCYGDLVYVSSDGSRVKRVWKSGSFAKGDFAKGWCPPHPTFYVRKSALEKYGLFDTSFSLASDADFMMRYLEFFSVKHIYIPKILICMRLGGATNKSWCNILTQNKEIFTAFGKNGIKFNSYVFWFFKLANRALQYWRAP